MNTGKLCPKCGGGNCGVLSTTNEWKYHCPSCDTRFSNDGDMLMPTPIPESVEIVGKRPCSKQRHFGVCGSTRLIVSSSGHSWCSVCGKRQNEVDSSVT